MDQKKGMFQDVDSSELRYRLKWAASVGHEPLRAAADITASTVHRQDWWDRLFSSSKHSFQQICNFKFIYKHFISYTICWWIYLFYNPEAPLYIPSPRPPPTSPRRLFGSSTKPGSHSGVVTDGSRSIRVSECVCVFCEYDYWHTKKANHPLFPNTCHCCNV